MQAPQAPQARGASEPTDPAPAEPAPPSDAPGIGATLDVVFDRLRARVREQDPGLFAVLQGTRLEAREPGRLRFQAPNAFARQRLEGRSTDLETVCGGFFGEPTRIEVTELAQSEQPSTRPQREDARRLRQEALNHPLVNTALEVLEAEIVEIRPLSGVSGSVGPRIGGAPE
jgi:DNA polymerase-3 subunit gamma/tau